MAAKPEVLYECLENSRYCVIWFAKEENIFFFYIWDIFLRETRCPVKDIDQKMTQGILTPRRSCNTARYFICYKYVPFVQSPVIKM